MKNRLMYGFFAIFWFFPLLAVKPLRETFYSTYGQVEFDLILVVAASFLLHLGLAGLLSGMEPRSVMRNTAIVHGIFLGPVILTYAGGGWLYVLGLFVDPPGTSAVGVRPIVALVIWWFVGLGVSTKLTVFEAPSPLLASAVKALCLVILPIVSTAAILFVPVFALLSGL